MVDIYNVFIYPIIYVLPAYVANAVPVLFGGKGSRPIDGGRLLFGKPILGKNKTIRGFMSGVLLGTFTGFIISFFFPYMLFIGITESIGTHLGDMAGSFIKRRMGKSSGDSFAFFDQYLFFLFAIALSYPLGHLPEGYGMLFAFILTGFMHVMGNRFAYLIHIKSVPW